MQGTVGGLRDRTLVRDVEYVQETESAEGDGNQYLRVRGNPKSLTDWGKARGPPSLLCFQGTPALFLKLLHLRVEGLPSNPLCSLGNKCYLLLTLQGKNCTNHPFLQPLSCPAQHQVYVYCRYPNVGTTGNFFSHLIFPDQAYLLKEQHEMVGMKDALPVGRNNSPSHFDQQPSRLYAM